MHGIFLLVTCLTKAIHTYIINSRKAVGAETLAATYWMLHKNNLTNKTNLYNLYKAKFSYSKRPKMND